MTEVLQQEVQGVPFSINIEPVAPRRIQMWAKFAGHATTPGDISLVTMAFHAFWWEAGAYNTFASAVSNWQREHIEWTLNWLDHTLFRLRCAIQSWETAVQEMTREGGPKVSVRLLTDTHERLDGLRSLAVQLEQDMISFCTVYGMQLPNLLLEAMGKETVEVLAQVQG